MSDNKRIYAVSLLTALSTFAIYAGKWEYIGKGAHIISEHPEEAVSFGSFLVALFLMCIPIAIVSGIVSIILKSVFDLNKDDTKSSFLIIGGILLAISLLIYFLV